MTFRGHYSRGHYSIDTQEPFSYTYLLNIKEKIIGMISISQLFLFLSFVLALVFALVSLYFPVKRKLLLSICFFAIFANFIGSYLQGVSEPPSRAEVKAEFEKQSITHADNLKAAVFDLKNLLSDPKVPPEISRIKTIAEKHNMTIDDLFQRLERGTPLARGFNALIKKDYSEAVRLLMQSAKTTEEEAANSSYFLGECI